MSTFVARLGWLLVMGLMPSLAIGDEPLPASLASFFAPPAEFAHDFGDYRSPLKFDDGRTAESPAEWPARRAEILRKWHSLMGEWPPLIVNPKVEYLKQTRRESFTQHQVRIETAPGWTSDGYLLIPDGDGPFPAALVVYYEPETAIGANDKPLRDFAYQLTRRGFVTLSLGSPPGSYYPTKAECRLQPLSFHAYVAANCHTALVALPQVDPQRIGVLGHSYGGKWAMFASCLYDKFACGVWSDGGIVFDEKRANVNYWEPWYLGFEPGRDRKPGIPNEANPRTGAYKTMIETGRDLHELHALMAPRPFLVSGGAEDHRQRWPVLNHAIAVNSLLGYQNRVAMTNRQGHSPTPESNAQIYAFMEHFLRDARPARQPLPGQIVIDADHPQWLKRHGGQHVFICGPGDPEDFLYAGKLRPDGTRDGDQLERIRKLAEHGGNCIYVQVVRSHGGDAKKDGGPDWQRQNPFVDGDPTKGMDEDILKQWDEWFALIDRHEILIYLFLYDDSARIWDTGDVMGPEERAFVEAIVNRYKRFKNLIWVIGEESEERYSTARVQAIAGIIQEADEYGHLIGDHHQSSTTFKAWQPSGAINHFAMQLAKTDDEAHAGAIEALGKAAGRYQVIYAESTAQRTDVDGMRSHAWAVAMAGLMPMLLRMDIASTPVESLQQCRHLQQFFEASDFWTMSSHDELAHAGAKYVLADPGRSYIVYGDQVTTGLGIKNLPAGKYAVTWMDCLRGERATAEQAVAMSGDQVFNKPREIGSQCAAWVRRVNAGQ